MLLSDEIKVRCRTP